jgi:carbon-monoxide dehydrogenase small subunit
VSVQEQTVHVAMTINGKAYEADIDPRLLLVEAIRETFGLKGTHIGCLTGDCGACTVEVDGEIEKSCLSLAASHDGAEIRTIEGLADGDKLHPVQQAFWDEYGFQCGYCLPGFLFAALDLLEQNPRPSEAEIRDAINGNLCRCTGYNNIVTSIATAAERMGGGK